MPTTSNFGWTTPADTDLVKDGAAAIRTLGNGIDASLVDLKGGTTGQVLAKASNTDLDFSWVAQDDSNAIQNAIVDAKGDLITATAADTPARLAVGTNGYILTADSTTATGLKWAAPATGGKLLQIVQATYSTQTTSSTSVYADTGLSATITPSSTSSKILVIVDQSAAKGTGATSNNISIDLLRNSTSIFESFQNFYTDTNIEFIGRVNISYLDSPATTSAITYKTQFKNQTVASSVIVQKNGNTSVMLLLEIGA